jgi:hypothetical protein
MDDFFAIANRVEAGLWFAISVGLTARSFFVPGRLRTIYWELAVAFALFGVSDLIEAHTGAWWRPPWLLALKGGCLVAIAGGFLAYYRARRCG